MKFAANLTIFKLGFSHLLSSFTLTENKALFICISLGFLIRLIPEILVYPLPIGFDTIHYAAAMENGVIWAHWSKIFTSSWLLYALIVPLYSLLQVDAFLLLKIVGPLLFGLNVAGIYWFSRRMLGWDLRMGVFAGVFFALQLASLRISWDLLRNTLGMGLLLFALAYAGEVDSKRGFAIFSVVSLLCVFAHEFAAVTLFVVVLGLMIWRLVQRRTGYWSISLGLSALPALAVFLVGMSLRFFSFTSATQMNIINAGDVVSDNAGVSFIVDYLSINTSVDSYGSYFNLALSVGLLFAVLFLPYVFMVVKGFFKNEILNLWTGLLLIGAFGCLLSPFAALQYWHRWMFMLVYPFTFYATKGFTRLLEKIREKNKKASLFSDKRASATVLLTFSLGIAYLFTPLLIVSSNESVPVASDVAMYFSTSPTVPYEDVNSVVEALDWLNYNLDASSCAILQHAFVCWGKLRLNKLHTIVRFEIDVDAAVNTGLDNGFGNIFFVWWNEQIGWYEISVPESFVRVQDFGRISIFVYESVNVVGS